MFLKYFISLLLLPGLLCDDERPVVETQLGKLRGYHKDSFEGQKFSAFEGIPYAKPPIGELRFKEPEPAEPWEGTWDAILVTECVQTDMLRPSTAQGEEDCLYLNVYVPHDKPNPEEKLDVIVHIHGGAFMWGSGHSYAHPEYLMDKNIIFITLNYRLGIFGFLSTEDDVVSGNNGLKDQVLALKWIKNNVASFGGNPDSITLTGLSAGGASVQFHYLSPLSKGLFHRGFSQSGVGLNPWSIQDEPLKKAKILAQSVGCPTDNTQTLVDCVRQRPLKHILTKIGLFHAYGFLPFAPFAPVIEKTSKNAFLTKNPYYLLAKGEFQDLPWISSNTAHEGSFPAAFLRDRLEEINEKWVELAPYLLEFNYTLSRVLFTTAAEEIKNFYIGKDKEINMDTYQSFVQMFSDRLFLVDAEKAVKLQAKNSKSPVYYFYVSYASDQSVNKTVAHAEDAQYIFFNMFRRQPVPNDLKMKDIFLELLTSFAKTGKPEIKGVTWDPTGFKELTYLNISTYEPENMKVQTTKQLAPNEFWKSQGFLENDNLVLIKDEL